MLAGRYNPNSTSRPPHSQQAPSHSRPSLPSLHNKNPYKPLLKIYMWRCASENCAFVNETMGSEEGKFRTLPSGNQLREPCWYGEKCEFCREVAGRESCLLQVRLEAAEERHQHSESLSVRGQEGAFRSAGEASGPNAIPISDRRLGRDGNGNAEGTFRSDGSLRGRRDVMDELIGARIARGQAPYPDTDAAGRANSKDKGKGRQVESVGPAYPVKKAKVDEVYVDWDDDEDMGY